MPFWGCGMSVLALCKYLLSIFVAVLLFGGVGLRCCRSLLLVLLHDLPLVFYFGFNYGLSFAALVDVWMLLVGEGGSWSSCDVSVAPLPLSLCVLIFVCLVFKLFIFLKKFLELNSPPPLELPIGVTTRNLTTWIRLQTPPLSIPRQNQTVHTRES